MVARAIAKYIRISPKKLRLVADLVKGKDVMTAMARLSSVNKKGAKFVQSVVHSAFSNARRKNPDKKVSEGDFFISNIFCDEGPALKRFRAASMGRAMSIRRRTSHLTVELDEVRKDAAKPEAKEKKPDTKRKALKHGSKGTPVRA